MSNDVLVITEHMDGKFSDVSFEMVGKAKELATALGGQSIAVALGSGVSANGFASDSTIHVDDAALSNFNQYATPNKAAKEFITPADLANTAIYPPPEQMEKLQAVMDLGDDEKMYSEVWTQVRSE